MRPDFFIANRLKLSEKGRSSISIKISIAGVSLSMAIMLLTIAIVSGFKKQITEKIIGFDSQISVTAYDSNYQTEAKVRLDDRLAAVIHGALPEASVNLSMGQPAMLKTDDNFIAVVFRSYDQGKDWTFIRDNLLEGAVPDFGDEESADRIILSQPQASKLDLAAGDKITACFFIDGKLRLRNLEVAAVYQSNFGEYDDVVAFASMPLISRLRGFEEGEATRIEVSGLDFGRLQESTAALSDALARAYFAGEIEQPMQVSSVLQSGAIYFNWLDLLDTNVVVIIILMTAISVFTLIASLFILILERVNMIGTLKTVGAPDTLIRRVFIILASKIMLRGLLIGNAVALAIIAVQYFTHLLPLDPESYYISFVPVRISAWQVVAVNVGAIIAALAVMVIPSAVITRMSPAKTVRFE